MSIPDRTLRAVGSEFRDHLTAILAKTIAGKPLVLAPFSPDSIQLSFRDGGIPTSTPLNTRYGPIDLFIGQICDAVEDKTSGRPRLRTRSYRYTLQPQGMDDPLFRWEYIAFPEEGTTYCRHHLQGLISFEIPDGRGGTHAVSLNNWHLPTGWTTVEEVIRFCIVDLGVTPLAEEWDAILHASDETFRGENALFA